MKKIIITIMLVLTVSIIFCWESVGFSINDHELVNSYKLPARGYSLFDIDFSGRGFYDRTDTKFKKSNEEFLIALTPGYKKYYESEAFKYSLRSDFDTRLHYYRSKNEDINSDYINRTYVLRPQIYIDYDYYIKDNIFLKFSLNSHYMYNEQNDSQDDHNDIGRYHISSSFIGIGIGRIRDVSPVFRALRFNERVKSLNKGLMLSDEQLKEAADKFALSSHYKNLYSRYEKYFWEELAPILGTEFNNLNLSETLYITEVMEEYIKRFQGYEIALGIDLDQNYRNYSYRVKEKELYIGPSIKFDYYNNINLKYQIGIFSTISYLKLIESDTSLESKFMISISNNHYFDITDRLRWNTTISLNYDYIWFEDFAGYIINSQLTSVMNYFIENNFSLYCRLKSSLEHVSSDIYENDEFVSSINPDIKRRERISLYFGGRYYFGNMF